MKATILEAQRNVRNLSVIPSGHGFWKIECDFYNRRYSFITADSRAVDNFNSEFWQKTPSGHNRRLQGYLSLCSYIFDHHFSS